MASNLVPQGTQQAFAPPALVRVAEVGILMVYIYITGPSHFKVKYLQIYTVNFDDSFIDMYTIT